jgi:hypothetical protein
MNRGLRLGRQSLLVRRRAALRQQQLIISRGRRSNPDGSSGTRQVPDAAAGGWQPRLPNPG